MNKLFIPLCLILFTANLTAQSDELIDKSVVIYHDSIQQKFKDNPAFSEHHSSTNLYQITYLSDGLKINGYIAQPIEPGNYPVIIFNRGGNRDFGALNDISANFILRKNCPVTYWIRKGQRNG